MDAALKDEMRRQAVEARRVRGDQATATAHLKKVLSAHRGAVLSGYIPMGDEIDPRPAMAAHDGPICLPVVVAKAQPLLFRQWAPGDTLASGSFGTSHPLPDAPVLCPTVLIVPLLAFDAAGNRLGYGGGFYDRTLAALGRPVAIGFAWAVQQVAALPHGDHDVPMDMIVTDSGVFPVRG